MLVRCFDFSEAEAEAEAGAVPGGLFNCCLVVDCCSCTCFLSCDCLDAVVVVRCFDCSEADAEPGGFSVDDGLVASSSSSLFCRSNTSFPFASYVTLSNNFADAAIFFASSTASNP